MRGGQVPHRPPSGTAISKTFPSWTSVSGPWVHNASVTVIVTGITVVGTPGDTEMMTACANTSLANNNIMVAVITRVFTTHIICLRVRVLDLLRLGVKTAVQLLAAADERPCVCSAVPRLVCGSMVVLCQYPVKAARG